MRSSAVPPSKRRQHVQPFSFAFYRHLIERAIEHGYRVTSFEHYDPAAEQSLILRHDVDYTLDGVLEFAQIEHALGARASYLFRVHADEYNLFSCTAFSLVRAIRNLGHEIGLHFEAMNAGRALNIDPTVLLKREKAVLETILGYEVHTCSEHREISGVVHSTPLYHEQFDPYAAGFKFFAMDPRYCSEMKYLSDSNAHWREGDPTVHYGKHRRMQVLIHADWWFEDDLLLKGPYVHPRGVHD
jgi:hypothetical protein